MIMYWINKINIFMEKTYIAEKIVLEDKIAKATFADLAGTK